MLNESKYLKEDLQQQKNKLCFFSCIWQKVLHSHNCSTLIDTEITLCQGEEQIDFYKTLMATAVMSPKEVMCTKHVFNMKLQTSIC